LTESKVELAIKEPKDKASLPIAEPSNINESNPQLLIPIKENEASPSQSNLICNAGPNAPFGIRLAVSPYHFARPPYMQFRHSSFSGSNYSQHNTPLNCVLPAQSPVNCFLPFKGFVDFSSAINCDNSSHTPQFSGAQSGSPHRGTEVQRPLMHSDLTSAFSPAHFFTEHKF
jgi:hypothetical protein